MPPTQIRETSSPVLPGFTYFLHDSSDPFGWQLAQHTPLSAFEGALTESLAVGDYVRTFSVTIVAAQAFYRLFWKPSTISSVIEEKTSPTSKPARRMQAIN